MTLHTIFVVDVDRSETVRLVMSYTPKHVHDVWLHVLRDRLNDPTIQREDVAEVLASLGEDALDYNIVAVVAGDVTSLYDALDDQLN